MNDYMRENQVETVVPQFTTSTEVAVKSPAAEAPASAADATKKPGAKAGDKAAAEKKEKK